MVGFDSSQKIVKHGDFSETAFLMGCITNMIFGGIKPTPMIVFAVYTMSFCQQYNLGVSLDSGASYFQRKPLVYHLQIMFIAIQIFK